MAILHSIDQLIGHTPMLELHRYAASVRCPAHLLAKLEGFNPAGSAKDRVALAMILDAEHRGILTPGAAIIEPTSGNTGIGLACVGTARGYQVILTMPDTMSVERQQLVAAYGAQVVLTPGAEGMTGAIAKAEALCRELPNAVILGQFDNPANPQAHYDTTGPEIWADTEGAVDVFVAGVGTGGTLSGVGKYLKEQNPAVEIVAVEPASSPLLSQGKAGPHGLQGIGANFIPKTLDQTVYDRIIPVTDDDARATARAVSKTEGILIGISGGAALWAAQALAADPAYRGKHIVVLLPDTGDRYLSTGIF